MHKATGAVLARNYVISGILRVAVVTIFFLISVLSATPFMRAEAQTQSFTFTAVKVEGNNRVDAGSVLRFAGIGRGTAVSAGELNDAYQRIIASGLFEEVEVIPQGSTLLIRVREYPVINVINFEGNLRIKDEVLAEIVKSKSRRVYSPAQAEADAEALTVAYRQAGRAAATVNPRIIRRSDNRVDLVFEVTEGKVVEVERMTFIGNRAFSDRRLRQVIDSKQAGLLRTFIQSDTFIAERIEFDKQMLRDFYLSRGYVDIQILDATAEIARERDAFFVTFSLREGQSFRFGKTSVVSEIEGVDAAEFAGLLKIRSGVTYSPTIIENNISRMEGLALRKGLNFVRIDPRITRNPRDLTLDVEFALVRGPRVFIERIDIEGNTTTLDRVVRREFRSVEGDPFNPREVRQSAERIKALGFFADAKVDVKPGSASDQVVVKVDVEEQPTGSLSLGLSYSVAQGPGFNIGLTESNFLGRGQFVGVNISTGTDNINSSISFVEPFFLGRDLAFKFTAFYNTTDNDNSRYSTQSIGLSPALEFPISENGRLELRYKIAKDKIFSVDSTSSTILAREEAQGSLVASSVAYTYSYDTRINSIDPKGGVLLRFGQEFAGLGGDVDRVITSGLGLVERRVFTEDVTLRAVLEGGAVNMLSGNSRVTDRFFGNGKIRGFQPNGIGPRDLTAVNEDALGGNYFAVARFEADFPLGLPEEYGITGGLFLDVGSVWSLEDVAGTSATVDDGFDLRSAIGFSVFWTTPLGPLRLNFSKVLKKRSYDEEQFFDLTVSTRF